MSRDSILQYHQAMTGQFTDVHPPIMAITLRACLKIGVGLGGLMFVQAVLGTLAVHEFSWQLIRVRKSWEEPGKFRWIPLVTVCILLLPITPLMFYLMTFWKDAWEAIALLWSMAIALVIWREGKRFSAARFVGCIVGLSIISTVALLARHNALVLLPVICVLFWLVGRQRSRKAAWYALSAPIATYVVVSLAISQLFVIRAMHVEDQVMALDLVGLCARDEATAKRLPYTYGHIAIKDFRERYKPGHVEPLFWDDPKIVTADYLRDRNQLHSEYWRALRQFPLQLIAIKLRAFYALLRHQEYWVAAGQEKLDGAPALNARFATLRKALLQASMLVWNTRPLNWIAGVQIFWIGIAVLLLIRALYRGPRETRSIQVMLVLTALVYDLSYLPATVSTDYRYLYPATLLVQAMVITGMLQWFMQRVAESIQPKASRLG